MINMKERRERMGRKWIYGKQDWKTFDRGQENCYLMTNELGGFSSLTMTGSAVRDDHAFLMACLKAPNYRYHMIHRLSEKLLVEKNTFILSSQDFLDGSKEEGYRYLTEFSYEDTPCWRFLVKGIEIEKEAAMRRGENTIIVRYRIKNQSKKRAEFIVTPFYRFRSKGQDLQENQQFRCENNCIESEGMRLYYQTNGTEEECSDISETYFYAYDACDGRRDMGSAKACHRIRIRAESGTCRDLVIVYSMEKSKVGQKDCVCSMSDAVIAEVKNERNKLSDRAAFKDDIASFLVKSAGQFIADRESTGEKTILAGFPFFEDWGRDTMVALPGLCISTGAYETAQSILRTFARYEKKGLMPNLFPEGKKEPLYNTADAALLFINCVWLLYKAVGDIEFVRKIYPLMERIIDAYRQGTDYNIHMDEDGLLEAGSGLDQVTWMDVRIDDMLPTPRHGKPVEINAYWYNALKVLEEFSVLLKENSEQYPRREHEKDYVRREKIYKDMAECTQKSFVEKFWMEEKHCLKDLLSGSSADEQIRCNQIWAVSLPFTMLEADKELDLVNTVFEKLYTPYGLRTLDPEDKQFHPFYKGAMKERDLAYHQGTVWVYPLGAYYLAFLKVHGYSQEAKREVKSQIEVLESALREGCIGQLPEIYDGENPVSSKGCFAQAWSVGEILRVYRALEEEKQQDLDGSKRKWKDKEKEI